MGDVARLAGVSRATASYVLNRTPGARIAEGTRARVREAASRLNYVPDRGARSLRRGRNDLVLAHLGSGVLPRSRLAATGLNLLADALGAAGYTFVLHSDAAETGLAAARTWLALRPAAVLALTGRLTPEGVTMLREAGVVVIGLGPAPSPLAPTIVLNHAEVGRVAVEHLARRGRVDIAVVVPSDPVERDMAEYRVLGARQAADAHGARLALAPIHPDPADAAGLVRRWRAGGLPDAVFGVNDHYATLVLAALVDAGVRVPEEVAVVGADDDPVCEVVRPRLTSVAVDFADPGARLVEGVLAALAGRWDEALGERPWPARLRRRDS